MRQSLKRRALDWAARTPPGVWMRKRLRSRSRHLSVLAYHGVDDGDAFDTQLDLITADYHPVSLDEVRAAAKGAALPSKAVLVTFDDGERSVLENAIPRMQRRGVPGVAFVVAGVLDTDSPWWWEEAMWCAEHGASLGRDETPYQLTRRLSRLPDDERRRSLDVLRAQTTHPCPRHPQLRSDELEQIRSAGIEVGNHSWSHPNLECCAAPVVRDEITRAQARLTDLLGEAPTSIAYPNGGHDARVVEVVAELGFELAFLFDHDVVPLPLSQPLRVSRLRIAAEASPERLDLMLTGAHSTLLRVQERVRPRLST